MRLSSSMPWLAPLRVDPACAALGIDVLVQCAQSVCWHTSGCAWVQQLLQARAVFTRAGPARRLPACRSCCKPVQSLLAATSCGVSSSTDRQRAAPRVLPLSTQAGSLAGIAEHTFMFPLDGTWCQPCRVPRQSA